MFKRLCGALARLLSGKFSPRGGTAPKHVPPAAEPSVERGEYLVTGPAGCAFCHTPMDPMEGFAFSGPLVSGQVEADPDPKNEAKDVIAPNLTPDPETGVSGKLDEEGFLARIAAGRAVRASPMPWEAYQRMTDADKRSIYRFLKSLPPTKHDVGPTYRDRGWSPQ